MRKNIWNLLEMGSGLFLMILIMGGCSEKAQELPVKSKDLVITDYVGSTSGFSEMNKILEKTGLNSLLAVRGPYTVFLPNDDAMKAYYAEKGVAGQEGLDNDFWNKFVLNLLVPSQLETGDFGLGSVRERNAIGDYLVTEFDGADVIINKRSKIIKRNIPAANGVIHIIDKAIDPVYKSIYEELSGNPSYAIFTKGLEKTGLSDTLHVVEFPFGTKLARTRFTILAIADTTFNRFGIYTIEDLIETYTDKPDEITLLKNGFYRFMEYHCLGETYYLNTFITRVYPILSYDNNISMVVDDNYRINTKPTTREFTSFIIKESNIPAKNGAIHTITDLMPVFEPKPTALVWESTDHFDLKQGDYYGKHYARWFDGKNTFANIKWEGDYLLYYWKNHNTGKLMNDDCLSILGWWWIEVTTPKIMKGKYKITSNLWSNHVSYAVYVDGVNTAQIQIDDPAETTSWGEFEWTTTTAHKIKLVATTPGQLMWDTILFTPIN